MYVVAGGSVTVPADGSINSDMYVIDGSLSVEGEVGGDVTVLGGNLSVGPTATIVGTLETFGGSTAVDPTASIGDRRRLPTSPQAGTGLGPWGGLVLQFIVLGGVGWVITRRRPGLLTNVGTAAVEHPVVTGVVGVLAGLSLLVLFVYMAFTLLLLPVSILGLLAQFVVVLYAYIAVGHRIGTHLPVADRAIGTVAGIAILLLTLELLARLPIVGVIAQLLVVSIGFGAVLVTYFGLQRFEPATIPEPQP